MGTSQLAVGLSSLWSSWRGPPCGGARRAGRGVGRPAVAEPLEGRRLLAAAAYDVTELSLGGSYSVANALNEAGQVAGGSYTHGDADFHAFLYGGGVMTDLGTLGGSYSEAFALNEAGQMAGTSNTAGDAASHAFLYAGGVMTDLGALGRSYSQAFALNEAGQTAGRSTTAGDGATHAFLYAGGVMTDLGTLGGTNSYGTALNEAGQVAGWSYTAGDAATHAFLYAGGVMTDLGTLGSTYSHAFALNEAGQVAGNSTTGDGAYHAFLYGGGVMSDLGTLGGTYSEAFALNEAGQVVGYASTASRAQHAFLYDGGVMTDLGTLGGPFSYATALNEAGHVVGVSAVAGGARHAFLYTDANDNGQVDAGEMADLNDLIPTDAGWVLGGASLINEAGHIVGVGTHDGRSVAFLLTPVSNEPPVAAGDAATTVQDNAVVVGVLANDADPDGDPLTVTAASDPDHGTAEVNADGTITYTPDLNYSGADGFTYTVTDGRGGTATAAVAVTVSSPAVATQSVIDAINAMAAAGRLTGGQANRLVAGKLAAAAKFLDGPKADPAKAAHHLRLFLAAASDVLPDPERDALVGLVEDVLAALEQ